MGLTTRGVSGLIGLLRVYACAGVCISPGFAGAAVGELLPAPVVPLASILVPDPRPTDQRSGVTITRCVARPF